MHAADVAHTPFSADIADIVEIADAILTASGELECYMAHRTIAMASPDLSTLAKRANKAYSDVPGFTGCSADTKSSPPTLVYHFTAEEQAESFKMRRQIEGAEYSMVVRGKTVVEQRP